MARLGVRGRARPRLRVELAGKRGIGRVDSPSGTLVMKEVMLPVCSPGYRDADGAEGSNTVIRLANTPGDWAAPYPAFLTRRSGATKTLSFSDYAVVVQAALLGPGIALCWLTVASHWLIAGALVPHRKR